MPIISSTIQSKDVIEAALSIVRTIASTALPTTDFDRVETTVVGNIVTFTYKKSGSFIFKIVVTDPLNQRIWSISETP